MSMSLNTFYSDLPDTTYTFSIDIEGNITKTKYSAKFQGIIPTNKMRSSIKRKEAMLNSGLEHEYKAKLLALPYDVIIDIHEAIAYLSIVLQEYPDWWSVSNFGEDFLDTNIIMEIYNKVKEQEDIWYGRIWNKETEKTK